MSDDNTTPDWLVGCLILISLSVGVIGGWMSGSGDAAIRFRDDAVKRGVAEYYLDANNNNNKQWCWKEAK